MNLFSTELQRFRHGPAVPSSVGETSIREGLQGAKTVLLQACTAHLAEDVSWLTVENREELESKLCEILLDYKNSGRAAPLPEELPFFADLVKHADKAMPNEGFTESATNNPLTNKGLDFIMDEMNGYPDGIDYDEIPHAAKKGFHTVIAGAGNCAIALAIRLKAAGIPFTILEMSDGIGGAWHKNIYPQVGCDTPAHVYSFSFAPNPHWSRYFAKGHEIYEYLQKLVDKHGLRPHVKLNCKVTSAKYNEEGGTWNVTFRKKDGSEEVIVCNAFVSCIGQLDIPNIPDLPGASRFKGPSFHTSQWDPTCEYRGKRVALIGTGASAMQVSPTLARECKHLTIFQLIPQWAIPIPNYHVEISLGERWCFANVPHYERWYRFHHLRHLVHIYYGLMQKGSDVSEKTQAAMTEYIKEKIGNDDPSLLDKTLPKYPLGCTRLLVDNGWYDMVKKENVNLVDGAAEQLTENSVIAKSGTEEVEVDIVIWATGFQSSKFILPAMTVEGKGKKNLGEAWKDAPSAYLGITVPEFPNLFMTYGPNSNVSSGGSIIWVAENQARYISQCIFTMVKDNVKSMECKQKVFEKYFKEIGKDLESTVWNDTGCTSWYKVGSNGRVVNNSPWPLEDYVAATRTVNLSDYETVSHNSASSDVPETKKKTTLASEGTSLKDLVSEMDQDLSLGQRF